MLYCPKCHQKYEDGSQRFCMNEGARLLPVVSSNEKISDVKQGVFSSLLNRQPLENENNAPRYNSARKPKAIVFEPVIQSKIFKPEIPSEAKIENKKIIPAAKIEIKTERKPQLKPIESKPSIAKPFETKPAIRLVDPLEIPDGTIDVTKQNLKPIENKKLGWEKPGNLIDQQVKGRYRIVNLSGADSAGFIYLAKDSLSGDKKVTVRIFIKDGKDEFTENILAEERVALSHIQHPNIVSVTDSGELPEGNSFIVNEFIDGESIAKKLARSGKFDERRAARIIRQAAYGLGEAHQNGVLHRNLKPQNIVLTVNEAGVEQVKIANFAISDGWKNEKDFGYLAPEQLEGKPTTFSSDIYSLAVIAYQMLTNRLPFECDSEEVLQRRQKRGVQLRVSDLHGNLPTAIDDILEKALVYNQNERYPKARDFGDAFFNALVNPPIKSAKEIISETTKAIGSTAEFKFEKEKIETTSEIIENKDTNYISFKPTDELENKSSFEIEKNSVSKDSLWEKRSPELPNKTGKSKFWVSILGLAILLAGLWGVWQYFLNNQTDEPQIETTQTGEIQTNLETSETKNADVESAPPERQLLQPANTSYFENNRENFTNELAKNYRGFKLYYPNVWANTPSKTNFLDIAKKNENGVPIEQMLVNYYVSKGTFKDDSAKFPALVKESNKLLAKQLPNYRFISEGAGEINNGWKIYEMKFEAKTDAKNGEPLTIYGRRIFMPAMRQGVKSGFLITMLATSLSPEVKSVDDVGTKGELKMVLESFEPSQSY